MNAIVLSATVCHLTVNVDKYGDAAIVRESGKAVWTGAQRWDSAGNYILVAGNGGNGSDPEDRVRREMVRALERGLGAAHDAKFGA